eukprot:SAG11_NODE_9463_length_909_cov_2.371605_1_plen_53_part_00
MVDEEAAVVVDDTLLVELAYAESNESRSYRGYFTALKILYFCTVSYFILITK